MRKKGISYFQLNVSAFEFTQLHAALIHRQPKTYFIWEDYALYGYIHGGVYTPVQFHITPRSIEIFKENRKLRTETIYKWNGVIEEYNGERFCDTLDEFHQLTAIGDWFREQLVALQENRQEFEYLTEINFTKRLGIQHNEHKSFQQKLNLFKRDIERFYGYNTAILHYEYFTHEFWYTGRCSQLTVHTDRAPIQLQFLLGQKKVNIYCSSPVALDEHPLLLQVVKMLMKERAYGQVSKVLLQEESTNLQQGR